MSDDEIRAAMRWIASHAKLVAEPSGATVRVRARLMPPAPQAVPGGYDFARKRCRAQAPADVRWQLDRLAELRRRAPQVRIFTIDYWDPRDPAGQRRIYAQQRRNGFIPYVATVDLQHVVPEPRR